MSLAGHSWVFVVIPVSCHGGRLSFVGGWSKWEVVVACAHFVLLFMGARDGGSLFFMCGHAHFLSLFVGGWSEHSSSLVGFRGLGGFVCGQPGFCLDGGQFMSFMGSRARFVWWVVMVHGLLGWTSHVVSGSAVVVRGWSHSPRIVVETCCSSSFELRVISSLSLSM